LQGHRIRLLWHKFSNLVEAPLMAFSSDTIAHRTFSKSGDRVVEVLELHLLLTLLLPIYTAACIAFLQINFTQTTFGQNRVLFFGW